MSSRKIIVQNWSKLPRTLHSVSKVIGIIEVSSFLQFYIQDFIFYFYFLSTTVERPMRRIYCRQQFAPFQEETVMWHTSHVSVSAYHSWSSSIIHEIEEITWWANQHHEWINYVKKLRRCDASTEGKPESRFNFSSPGLVPIKKWILSNENR